MTDNEKLARWQGWECINGDWVASSGRCENLGMTANYPNDDAANSSLLDTLVEKGYYWEMKGCKNEVWFEINKPYSNRLGDWTIVGQWQPTRREAVVAAVLELIKEGV